MCYYMVYYNSYKVTSTHHMKKQIDHMRPSAVKRVRIIDRTHTKQGVPTFLNMQRRLVKEMRHA